MNQLKPARNLLRYRNHRLPAIGAAVLMVCGALPAAPPAQARAPVSTAPTEVTQAIAALRDIATMQADFTQTDANGQQVSGVLTLKRPGRIRFQYAPGVGMLIISDGRALVMIDSAVNQVKRWPIRHSPLGALLDPDRDVARFSTLQPMLDPNVIGVEVRDRSRPEYGALTLAFIRNAAAPGGIELTGWVATDSQNNRTVIRLSHQRYGMAVADELFSYLDTRGRPHK
jgi:outer membrane lipoprotein-sorting protein